MTTQRHPSRIGNHLLKRIDWQPDPNSMLKLPSVAKGTALRALCDCEAAGTGQTVQEIIDCVRFAARIEHLVAIGGEDVRHPLLEQSLLTSDQIARLCHRMPPFIEEKLRELRRGLVDIDSNPNGAFDTNGRGELIARKLL